MKCRAVFTGCYRQGEATSVQIVTWQAGEGAVRQKFVRRSPPIVCRQGETAAAAPQRSVGEVARWCLPFALPLGLVRSRAQRSDTRR